MDNVTEQRIKLLHPKIREIVTNAIIEANNKLTAHSQIRITQGLRTIEEQNALYAQGRTKPGNKVTNAKGGSSFHNYGLAIDFVLLIDNKEVSWSVTKDYDQDGSPDWMEVVNVFKSYGFVWGGDFKSIKDNPHFEMTFGYSWQQLLKKYNSNDVFIDNGIKYVNI